MDSYAAQTSYMKDGKGSKFMYRTSVAIPDLQYSGDLLATYYLYTHQIFVVAGQIFILLYLTEINRVGLGTRTLHHTKNVSYTSYPASPNFMDFFFG